MLTKLTVTSSALRNYQRCPTLSYVSCCNISIEHCLQDAVKFLAFSDTFGSVLLTMTPIATQSPSMSMLRAFSWILDSRISLRPSIIALSRSDDIRGLLETNQYPENYFIYHHHSQHHHHQVQSSSTVQLHVAAMQTVTTANSKPRCLSEIVKCCYLWLLV